LKSCFHQFINFLNSHLFHPFSTFLECTSCIFHPLCNFLSCFPWKTGPNYLEFPHCFARGRELRPITLDSHPLCNFPRCLWGSSSSFHPVSILPKSFQGKCGKVLEMPSLEKFLEWLLRKHPVFASIVQLHHLYV